jgi:hypothetical protein
MHVNLRLGEVRQTAGVIELDVSEHDVAHVLAPEPESLDLRQRGICVLVASIPIAGPKNAPSRRVSRTSSTPMPVSTSTSP